MSCQQMSRLISTATVTSVSSEDLDPYVFTESVPTTPPILFNTQKSRSRLLTDVPVITTPTLIPTATVTTTTAAVAAAANSQKRPTPTTAVATNAKLKLNQKLPLGPLNGNTPKTQASSTVANACSHSGATAAPPTTKTVTPTTLKNAATQSQKQQQHKKALNVCVVRPQQQQQPAQTPRQQQQQHHHYKVQQRKQISSPPPLLQHTPSLWQTPLILDTTPAVVSPPTSPASLPSPPVVAAPTPRPATALTSSPTTAATALVSPLITSSVTKSLPPSKFHHTTLAQHLQKVECIKKPKKLNVGGDGITVKLVQQFQQQQHQQCEVDAKAVVTQSKAPLTRTSMTHPHQALAQMHKQLDVSTAPPPLQAIQAVPPPPQHSDSDLNEIPVNVIFRQPQMSDILHSQLGGNVGGTSVSGIASRGNSGDSNNKMVNNRGSAFETKAKINIATIIKPKHVKGTSPRVQSKPLSVADLSTKTTPLPEQSLQPTSHVLPDIVFTHTGSPKSAINNYSSTLPANVYSTSYYHPPAATPKLQQDLSSKAQPQQQQPPKYDPTTPSDFVRKPVAAAKHVRVKNEKVPEIPRENAVKAITPADKSAHKRKAACTVLIKSNNTLSALPQKRSRKMGPLYAPSNNHMHPIGVSPMDISANGNKRKCRAVAVVKMSTAELEADTTLLASATVLPYCIQQHWLHDNRDIRLVGGLSAVTTAAGKGVGNSDPPLMPASERETRIMQRKVLLRRQAMQMLSTHSLQKSPMQAAKRRLICVDRLLRKYERRRQDDSISPKKCDSSGCCKSALEMTTQCKDHIVDNTSQQIFLPCTAKFADNTQCRIPVFDITHDLPLCEEHARKRDAYSRAMHEQHRPAHHNSAVAVASKMARPSLDCDAGDLFLQLQQIQHQHKQQQQQQKQLHPQHFLYNIATVSKSKKSPNAKVTQTRKRKAPPAAGSNAVGRPQKRTRKVGAGVATAAPLQLSSAVLHRKSSTTSLESIASNSQSSNSQPHYMSSNINGKGQSALVMPALAPLSGRNAAVVSSTSSPVPAPKRMINFSSGGVSGCGSDSGVILTGNDAMTQDLKPHEINQLVAQFSVAVNNNSYNDSSNSLTTYSNSSINNSYNYISTNCDSNFTSVLGSSSSLPSTTEELFRQELLSVCENSSAYASSEDTGLGGLSETELMVGANDADDIPLGDTRLLEEHDLANVLSALPEDAFNELFTAVHQEERDEVERALELADKHLKSLQQTIGSDIDFLGEFPDDDEILADTNAMCGKMDIVSSVMRSPEATSGIDTSTLFLDSGSNSAGDGGSVSAANNVDIRGLVQT